MCLLLSARGLQRARISSMKDVLSYPPGVGHDGERGVGASRGRERPTIHDKQVVNLVRLTVLVEYGRVGVVAHARSTVLVRAVARDALGVDAIGLLRPGGLQDLGVTVDNPAALRQVVGMRLERDTRDGQAPRILHIVVELHAVVVLGHVVEHHADGEAVVVKVPVHLLGFGTPRWTVREAPVDRERYSHARRRDVRTTHEAARIVVLIELEAARGDVATAGPG